MIDLKQRLDQLSEYNSDLENLWSEIRSSFRHKVIALDDDPTGVQTVHGIPVFTDWSKETIRKIFEDDRQLVFLLTNSRSFSKSQTKEVHTEIAKRIAEVSKELDQPFLLISRGGDSTLRGHYPLETEVLKDVLEKESDHTYDGEIIIPFFKEGGRLTIDDIHYVQQGNSFIPAGETEFANDRMFGFKSSNLKEYVEEKTEGLHKKENVLSISLDECRSLDISKMTKKLQEMTGYQKMVVNAVTEDDLKAFTIALITAINNGKHFIFRTAASFTKVIGNISSKPLLTKEELVSPDNKNGGLIIVGSHVQKTTDQLNHLKKLDTITFVEFNVETVTKKDAFIAETERIQALVDTNVAEGKSICVYTSRKRLDLGKGRGEEELSLSVKISDAVTQFVNNCKPKPKYVIAKGGITSSDIGVNGLEVKKAEVAGQIEPGIPVWKTGEESKFPNVPYIIFPGNVGEEATLLHVTKTLEG
ncbi:hypothetical protein JCM21714_4637 [Gracilibacillus boraciitolerans JCM 21714]|uniref:Hydroxyacid dehydrogenase n=1 Tax=Gracilibacillus boraciitolerans JCM 21714 TaxID=1298598 RepID=W4VQC2_9BACI|nr:four-carbon acid sugar kinase family protein [Gracilibacillus boraciitolerans]GAE95401.1 hypothetical protein JCM21714_4637 [Gracilibacillus boraciitolerans JCM 21714]